MNCVKCGGTLPDGAAFCPACGQAVAPKTTPAAELPQNEKQSNFPKVAAFGCLALFVVIVLLGIIGSGQQSSATNNVSSDQNLAALDMNATAADTGSETGLKTGLGYEEASPDDQDTEGSSLTASQANAVRSAKQYLSMTGFSREGLIDQLSSDAGEGYSLADATAAVDSLSVDWNENAARSAKQYLQMSGFSCQGLIEQLSSSAGEKYTRAQATYGARQAGAC